MNTTWYHISKTKSVIGNNDGFSLLFKCALVVLLTPHANASIERVFSLVNKCKSKGSNHDCLDIEGPFSLTLAVKLVCPESVSSCLDYDPDDKLLQAAEKVTVNYNKLVTRHSSKDPDNNLL